MTDADLNALFATDVAGWKKHWDEDPGGNRYAEWVDAAGNVVDEPNFTASMDAVLPYMNKTFAVWSYHPDRPPGHLCADVDREHTQLIEAWGPLPRACVLALLRAKGVGV